MNIFSSAHISNSDNDRYGMTMSIQGVKTYI